MNIFCLHEYKKWSRPVEVFESYKHQFRECKKCGKVKARSVKIGVFGEFESNAIILNKALDLVKD